MENGSTGKDLYSASRHYWYAFIAVLLIALHLIIFAILFKYPSRQSFDAGYYQRRMATWYIPQIDNNYYPVPRFARSRVLTPFLVGLMPMHRLTGFISVTYFAVGLTALLIFLLLIKNINSLLIALMGTSLFLFQYGIGYALYNPFIPDALRMFTFTVFLSGFIFESTGLLILSFVLSAMNHESLFLFAPLLFFMTYFRQKSLFSSLRKTCLVLLPGTLVMISIKLWTHYTAAGIPDVMESRFSIGMISRIFRSFHGITDILWRAYSGDGPILLMFLLILAVFPSVMKRMAFIWILMTFLQMLIATDTLRMIAVLTPLVVFFTVIGISRVPEISRYGIPAILCPVLLTQIFRFVYHFHTRFEHSIICLNQLSPVNFELVNLCIMLPVIGLIFLKIHKKIKSPAVE